MAAKREGFRRGTEQRRGASRFASCWNGYPYESAGTFPPGYSEMHQYSPTSFPGGTYLIVHTHPVDKGPAPSANDITIANSNPSAYMYSIHATGVWMYKYGMETATKVMNTGWDRVFGNMTEEEACGDAVKDNK